MTCETTTTATTSRELREEAYRLEVLADRAEADERAGFPGGGLSFDAMVEWAIEYRNRAFEANAHQAIRNADAVLYHLIRQAHGLDHDDVPGDAIGVRHGGHVAMIDPADSLDDGLRVHVVSYADRGQCVRVPMHGEPDPD